MKKITYPVFLILLFFTNPIKAQREPVPDFYPLEIGDFIEYRDYSPGVPNYMTSYLTIYREVIGDTVLTNGLTYKIVKLCCCANTLGLEPILTFERKDEEGKVYVFYNNKDFLLYNFNLETGSIYPSQYKNLWWQIIHVDSELIKMSLFDEHTNEIYQSIDFKKGVGPTYYTNLTIDSCNFENITYFTSIINGIDEGLVFSIKDSFSSDKYYPLNTGDIFVYRDCKWFVGEPRPCGTIIKRVLNDTTLIDGLSYKKIKYEMFGLPDLFPEYKFERKDNNGNIYESNGYQAGLKLKNTFCLGDTFYSNIFYDNFNSPWTVYQKFGGPDYEINLIIETDGGDGTTVILSYIQGLYTFGSNFIGRGSYLVGAIINGKLWGDTSTVITSVNENNLIEGYFLSQNYPNPFNPTTQINYSLQESNFVSLKVYNSIAELVSTLVNEEKPAGSYSISFDGSGLPSGIYFYRLTSGSFNETRKMILLK